jgi:succinyl-CoA synthetase beta subunit
MKLFEYQAKELFRDYGIPTLSGAVVKTPEDAAAVADGFSSAVVVLKSQAHLGGRGKGHFVEHGPDGPRGVMVLKDKSQIGALASQMLGSTLQTAQGQERIECLYVEEGCAIKRELYAAMAVDRASGGAVLMASVEGGVDIEEVAASTPERILKEKVNPAYGLFPFQARRLGVKLGLEGEQADRCGELFMKLSRLFTERDASLAEINPLVLTEDDDVIALDGKLSFDENALFRHQDIVDRYDRHGGLDPVEIEAAEAGLSYVKLDGVIGCLVNGAGLAMATMDIIKHEGSAPANFLDVGGAATEARVTRAFEIILKDPNVEAILVNIFGGIVKCDMIAAGIINATRAVGLKVPLVVRLEGTNRVEGRQLLADSGLPITTATSMADAAQKVVAAIAKSE